MEDNRVQDQVGNKDQVEGSMGLVEGNKDQVEGSMGLEVEYNIVHLQ